jgi:hypothetical protein
MAICGPAVMPHSHFLGGPLVWTDLDREKQRAWYRREQETHSCGVHPDVWDPERGGDPQGLRMGSRLCGACEIAETTAPAYEKKRVAGEYRIWEFGPPPEHAEDPNDTEFVNDPLTPDFAPHGGL